MRIPLPPFRKLTTLVKLPLLRRLPGIALLRRHRSAIVIVLIAGLGTGMIRVGDEPVMAAPAARSAAPGAGDSTTDGSVDGAATADPTPMRHYLVILRQPPPTTTTTSTTDPATTTTSTASAARSATPREALADTHVPGTAPAIPVRVEPGEETQQATIVRVDGSRLVVAVPLRYLTLVLEGSAPAGLVAPGGTRLVRDRDGRYWATDLQAVPAVLHELPGQLAPPAGDESSSTTTTTSPAATTTTSAASTTTTTTTTTMATTTSAAPSAGAMHGPQSTTTDAPAVSDPGLASGARPETVIGPVAPSEREAVLALAAIPGVREVRPIGGGVIAVAGDIDVDIDALLAAPGVARVLENGPARG